MRLNALAALSLAAALTVSGCRQPDGPMPAETGDVPNRISDLRANLENVARGDASAPKDLADDLKVFIDDQDRDPAAASRAADELSRRVSAAVKGRTVPPQAGTQIARQLWMTMASRELSLRQIDKLQDDMTASLVAVGAPEQSAEAVAEQVAEVQKALNVRERAWYQFF